MKYKLEESVQKARKLFSGNETPFAVDGSWDPESSHPLTEDSSSTMPSRSGSLRLNRVMRVVPD